MWIEYADKPLVNLSRIDSIRKDDTGGSFEIMFETTGDYTTWDFKGDERARDLVYKQIKEIIGTTDGLMALPWKNES